MKNLKLLSLLLILGLISSSCLREVFCEEGEGAMLTETFILHEFTGIDLQEDAEVFIKQGPVQEVKVTARENILDRLRTNVNGGIWDINLGRDCYQDLQLRIEITMAFIDEIHLSGSGFIIVEDFDGLANVDLSVSGSGFIEVGQFTGTRDVDIDISGNGEILATAAFPDLEKMTINLSGSGNFDGFKMMTKELDAKIVGSGDLFVTVEDYVNVKITGSGDLHYKGNPLIDADIRGSGKIINEN